jgi:hypothetical protein
MGYKIRKLLIVFIMLLPVISYTGCKKQAKCGCDGDKLFRVSHQIFDHSSLVYTADGTNAYFIVNSSGGIYYDTYYLCNPSAKFADYKKISSNDQIDLSGNVFWDCSFVQSASSSSSSSSYYYSYYKVYNIMVDTLVSVDPYGKK